MIDNATFQQLAHENHEDLDNVILQQNWRLSDEDRFVTARTEWIRWTRFVWHNKLVNGDLIGNDENHSDQ